MDILIKQFDLVVGRVSLVPDFNRADQFDLARPMGDKFRPRRGTP